MPLTYLGFIEERVLESRAGEVLTALLEILLDDAGSTMEVFEQRKRCERNIFDGVWLGCSTGKLFGFTQLQCVRGKVLGLQRS
eukprot:840429-Amorphochlora_amoeboformis.AAC.1